MITTSTPSINTGTKIWEFITGDIVDSSPIVANGIVYIGSNDHLVLHSNANTGTKIWSYLTGGAVSSSPTIANGISSVRVLITAITDVIKMSQKTTNRTKCILEDLKKQYSIGIYRCRCGFT